MDTKPIGCSQFWVSDISDKTMQVVGCDVRYDGITYSALELYDSERDIIQTGDNGMLQALGLNHPCGAFWRFLDVEPGSEAEIEATRIEETIISSMRFFLDRRINQEAA